MKTVAGAFALVAFVSQAAPQTASETIASARSAYLERRLHDAAQLLLEARAIVQAAPKLNRSATAPSDPSKPLRAGIDVPHPRRTRTADAKFPRDAQIAGVSGVVTVEVDVDPKGKVGGVRVLRSVKGLDQAAVDAVKQWRYTPTLVNSIPVPITTAAAINFTFRTDPMPLEQIDMARFYEEQRQYDDAEIALTRALEAIDLERGGGPGAAGGPTETVSSVTEPRALLKTPPKYPPAAIAARVTGVVIIAAVIDATGSVVGARVVRSVPMLDQAAIDAVRKWRYQPALVNGVATPIMFSVSVVFQLAQE